jgi:hypothetical protein
MKALFRLVCLFVALVIVLPSELWARGASGGSFGGGRSSSSSSSSRSSSSSGGSSRSSSGSSWGSSGGSSTKTTTTSSGGGSSWGSSSRFSGNSSGSTTNSGPSSSNSTQRSGPTSSATDAALGRKVGQGGQTFASRSDAVKDFQQKHAADYKSTFPKEPSTRPDYIPPTTTVGGNNYHITYNSGYGGYGYYMGNQWMAYNVMSDAIMMNSLMNRHNYAYNDYGPGYGGGPTYYHRSSGGGVFVGLLFIIILVIAAVVVVKYLSSKKAIAADPYGNAAPAAASAKMGAMAPPPLRDLKKSPMDKSKPEDWMAVRPGSVVTISDTQGIADSMKRGLGVRGIDYTVSSVGRLRQVNGLSTHLLFTLKDESQMTYLLVKIVDDLIDLGLYFEPDGLAPGTRQELVDRGALWLFQEPSNPQNFDPAELRYTTTIRQTLPKAGGGQEEVVYDIKPQGELQCDYFETPPRSGMSGEALATIVEYRTAQETENPEFLVLEIGEKNGASSYVQFFLGCGIKFSEVDVLPA